MIMSKNKIFIMKSVYIGSFIREEIYKILTFYKKGS